MSEADEQQPWEYTEGGYYSNNFYPGPASARLRRRLCVILDGTYHCVLLLAWAREFCGAGPDFAAAPDHKATFYNASMLAASPCIFVSLCSI